MHVSRYLNLNGAPRIRLHGLGPANVHVPIVSAEAAADLVRLLLDQPEVRAELGDDLATYL